MGAVVTCDIDSCEELYRVYGRAIDAEGDAEKAGWIIIKRAYKGNPLAGVHLCPTHGRDLNGLIQ
jgi:hypothetical protein